MNLFKINHYILLADQSFTKVMNYEFKLFIIDPAVLYFMSTQCHIILCLSVLEKEQLQCVTEPFSWAKDRSKFMGEGIINLQYLTH